MYKKQFKDPIYGYIDINSDIVANIIDTPAFQRLKDIRQTSYTPLYPAAYHNRFVHSLGVYHLGKIAFGAIKEQLVEKSEKTDLHSQVERIGQIFELACLLHDVGHAPFSHTGETFFIDKEQTLYKLLVGSVNDDLFTKEFEELGAKKPAPHECMSCVVGIKTFPEYFTSSEERSLFARCIIGMPMKFSEKIPNYDMSLPEEERNKLNKQIQEAKIRKTRTELLNCVISLLNSSIIDVDRLDYIIRDAATIGFKNAQVDYMRLLNGMRIVTYNKSLCIGYHKSAISVIESAVYAHDSEKKWVQGHPSILYEMEALKNAMSTLTTTFSSDADLNPLFCYDALTETGKTLTLVHPLFSTKATMLVNQGKLWTTEAQTLATQNELFTDTAIIDVQNLSLVEHYPVSLLADEDFLYLMKQFCKEGLGYEYFARNRRRSAVWKSEAEFRALFQERIGDGTKAIQTLETDFESLVDYCQNRTGCPIVTEKLFSVLDQEESDANKAKDNHEIDDEVCEDLLAGVETRRFWCNILRDIHSELDEKIGIEFEFLIIFQKKFSSSFKSSIGKIPILFPNIKNSVVPLENVIDVLNINSERRSNFFHIYYKPKGLVSSEQKKVIVNTIADKLIAAASSR